MVRFYSFIICGLVAFGTQACKSMSADEIVQQRMNMQISACHDIQGTSAKLNELAQVMKQNNRAAMINAQTKAREYDNNCSEKESIKAVLLAGHDGAHAGLQAFREVIQCLPVEMSTFLQGIFRQLRALLLNSEHADSVGHMLKKLESYDLLTQQVIRQIKIDLEQAYFKYINVEA